MKKALTIWLLALLSALTGFSQQTMELTFTAIDSSSYVQLDSIKVMNSCTLVTLTHFNQD